MELILRCSMGHGSIDHGGNGLVEVMTFSSSANTTSYDHVAFTAGLEDLVRMCERLQATGWREVSDRDRNPAENPHSRRSFCLSPRVGLNLTRNESNWSLEW